MRSEIETTAPDVLEGIVKTLNEGFQTTIKNTLSPWIKKMGENEQQYAVVSSVLKQLPEFQKLIAENAELRLELTCARKKIVELESANTAVEAVQLHVHEKQTDEDKDATSRVAEVYKEANLDQKSSENSPYSKPSFIKPVLTTSTVHDVSEDDDDEDDEEESDDDDDDDEEEAEVELQSFTMPENKPAGQVWSQAKSMLTTTTGGDEEKTSVGDVTAVANKWDKAEHDRVIQGEEEEEDEEDEDEEDEEEDEEDEEEDEEDEDEEDEDEEDEAAESDDDPDVPKVERAAVPEVKAPESDTAADDDEEEEVFVVELEGADDPTYYTNDEDNGNIYKILDDEDIGEKVGEFQNGEPIFFE